MEHEPDRLEKGIRLGCGGLLGAVIGFFFILELPLKSYGAVLAACACGAIVCGVLAMRYGDRFWEALKDWWL